MPLNVLYCVVLCSVVLCCVVLCCVVLCCVVLCCVVLYCIVLYYIVLYWATENCYLSFNLVSTLSHTPRKCSWLCWSILSPDWLAFQRKFSCNNNAFKNDVKAVLCIFFVPKKNKSRDPALEIFIELRRSLYLFFTDFSFSSSKCWNRMILVVLVSRHAINVPT